MRVTGIGGGHGLATTLRAARLYAGEVDAVVTVADDGGSSGRLTRELGIPAPGDIRNCLVALAGDERLADLYQHRFRSGALTGHTAGNLVIAALAEMTGDFAAAVVEAGRLLGATGRVHPATTQRVELRAWSAGEILRGQVAVAQARAPIQAVYLDPSDPPANPAAVAAIRAADQVVLGPGSLFTSLIATVLVPGVRDALRTTRAQRVYVCNTRMQKGETEGLGAGEHLEALLAHAGPFAVDAVVVQSPPLRDDGVAIDGAGFSGVQIVEADVASVAGTHDAGRLARVLRSLA
ncbi:MAG TPA: gluconeogenesis factor YvcK family protein [Actinomycetota bacterium]|nr:gluconeogenesis factor YvcK family protein [Actinomycetota bacterium]